jgi:hypothetical protein
MDVQMNKKSQMVSLEKFLDKFDKQQQKKKKR